MGKVCFRGFQREVDQFFFNGVLQVFRGLPLDANTRVAYIIQGTDASGNFTTDYFTAKLGIPYRTHSPFFSMGRAYTWHGVLNRIHAMRQRINRNSNPIPIPGAPVQGIPFNPFVPIFTPPPAPPPGSYVPSNAGREIFMILDTRYSKTESPTDPGFSLALPPDVIDLVSRLGICFANRQAAETALAAWPRTYVFVDRTNRSLPMETPPMRTLILNNQNEETPVFENPYRSNFICVDPRYIFPNYSPNIINAEM